MPLYGGITLPGHPDLKLTQDIVLRGYRLTTKDLTRFFKHVKWSPDTKKCWMWVGGTTGGYGILMMPGNRTVRANRIACWLLHGPPPEGEFHACHSCDIPSCCNPFHLFWGSRSDNHKDCGRKGRCATQRYPEIVLGSRNPAAILTEKDVLEIRKSSMSRQEAADYYGVSTRTIKAVRCREKWGHI